MKRLQNELVEAIVREQRPDGSFLSLSAAADGQFGADARTYTTTFATSAIALAVAGIHDARLERVREKAVDWLLAQASAQWSFNYWGLQEEPEAQTRPYPDDWDDTSCALAAITRIRPEAVTGEAMAEVVTMLTNTEVREGGPYRTWIVGADADEAWQDVDAAVNSNVAYLLSLHGVSLPSLNELAEEAIRGGELKSPYYPSAYPLVYFLSRWYRGELSEELATLALGDTGDPLQAALAITAAINLAVEPSRVEEQVEALRATKLASLTAPYAFCLDPGIVGRPFVGSGALTAAICLEALHAYEEACRLFAPGVSKKDRPGAEAQAVHDQIVERVMSRYERMPVEIRDNAGRVRERVLGNDPARQVTLLPYLFRGSVGGAGAKISDERLVDLGTVSLYGWLAYTIYDDFLDNEGEPPMLPLGNIALRELVLALERDPAGPDFVALAWRTMDRMEAANAWEVGNCRFGEQRELLTVAPPDYGELAALAERSLGHALGCLAMMAELGYGPDSPESQALQRFFEHFLIARQLNDEAHDWKEDLEHGHINAVGAELLAATPKRGRSVPRLYERLESYFWTRGINEVCDRIFVELAAAREALQECGALEHPERMEALLEPVERAAQEAQDKQRQTLEFLRAYRKNNQ